MSKVATCFVKQGKQVVRINRSDKGDQEEVTENGKALSGSTKVKSADVEVQI